MGAIIPGTVPRIIATLLFAEVRVVSENGRGLYTRSGRRIAKLPISPPPQLYDSAIAAQVFTLDESLLEGGRARSREAA